MAGKILRLLQDRKLAAVLANCDLLSRGDFEGRNVDLPPVDGHVAMTHQLARLTTRDRKPQPVNHVVQSTLQLLQEHPAGHAPGASGLLKIIAELPFLREIHALCFLLFTQLEAVANDFGLTVFPMLSGSEISLFNRALVTEAFGALQ